MSSCVNFMSAQRRLQAPDLHLLSTSTEAPVVESGPHETRILRRHARDLTAVLALPAMWHGREPAYIMGSLLDVLLSLLRLDSAYVRFDDPDGGPAIEDWRPQSPAPPAELIHAMAAPLSGGPTGITGCAAAQRMARIAWCGTSEETISYALSTPVPAAVAAAPRSIASSTSAYNSAHAAE